MSCLFLQFVQPIQHKLDRILEKSSFRRENFVTLSNFVIINILLARAKIVASIGRSKQSKLFKLKNSRTVCEVEKDFAALSSSSNSFHE